jgi:PucR C-terminal helix-turn-helix domain/GGDEF-like domain
MGPGEPNAGDAAARRLLTTRLQAREGEISDRILAHVQAISEDEPERAVQPAALRRTVAENLRFGLQMLEQGINGAEEVVEAVLRQAKEAVRNGVSFDTVSRRFAAGERLFVDLIIEEAYDVPPATLHRILSAQRQQVDRLLKALAEAHSRHREALECSPQARLEQQVSRLLAGDPSVDLGSVDYPFEGWHVGLVMIGKGAEESAREIAGRLGRRCLALPRPERVVWTWIGGRISPSGSEVEEIAGQQNGVSIAMGEPRRRLEGWRQTHNEARAAFQVMRRRPCSLIRARDVLLLAALLRDETLARSLHDTFMAPLDNFGGSAGTLRETLRAYLKLGGNAVAAAAALDVDRHTVHRRLRKVEEAIGVPLHGCHGELTVALELEQLNKPA